MGTHPGLGGRQYDGCSCQPSGVGLRTVAPELAALGGFLMGKKLAFLLRAAASLVLHSSIICIYIYPRVCRPGPDISRL